MAGVRRLNGSVKYYDWGGTVFIPSLLRVNNEAKKPFAEYWMGVHPQADCTVLQAGEQPILLRDYIDTDPQALLGTYVSEKFGTLPYLLKALDVRDMLSIQVHPSKKNAQLEFEKENAAGIPLDSPQRNYKDANHKPELMVAIDDFWLLHGFKQQKEIEETLTSIRELSFLLPVFKNEGYKELYKTVMELPQSEVNDRLQPLLDRIIPLYHDGKLEKANADYWAAKGSLTFSRPGTTDRGIFSVYLFNLLHLKKGEAIFQDAGIPHAYLYGQNVEIMASSDNVLRGGLTTKHVDVAELLKHTRCEATTYKILKGELQGNERVYKTPAPDFELGSFYLTKGDSIQYQAGTTEIFLLIEGKATLKGEGGSVIIERGTPSAVIFAGDKIDITADENSLVFKATVPLQT